MAFKTMKSDPKDIGQQLNNLLLSIVMGIDNSINKRFKTR